MKEVSLEALEQLKQLDSVSAEKLAAMAALEQKIDDMTRAYRSNQPERMQCGICSGEACVLDSELLTDFQRIGDCVLKIGREMARLEKSFQPKRPSGNLFPRPASVRMRDVFF